MNVKDYYAQNEIFFTKPQVVWMLRNITIIRQFRWPPEHKETGYTGRNTKRRRRSPYEDIAGILAVLEKRLEKAGQDGLLLELFYSTDTDVHHIAKALRIEPKTVSRRVNKALEYVSGRHGKAREYKPWLHHKKGKGKRNK